MSRLLDLFDQVYVINLPSRQDRRKEIAAQLDHVGSRLNSRNVTLFPAQRPDGAGGFASIGARGCFYSHLGVLQDAARQGLNRILILEDDLDFTPDFLSRERAVANALVESEWGVFYGGFRVEEAVERGASPVCELASDRAAVTAHFIGFQGETIRALAKYLEAMLQRPAGDPNGGPMHVDGAYSWYRARHPQVRTLLAAPELGDQRSSRSDICSLHWYDRLFGVRDVVAAMRRSRRASLQPSRATLGMGRRRFGNGLAFPRRSSVSP